MRVLSFHKTILYFLAGLVLILTAMAAYTQELTWLFVPFGLLFVFFLLQHPPFLLYILAASIPWSVEYNFSQSLATDLPDEPLMILAAFAVLTAILHQKEYLSYRKLHPLLVLILFQLIWTIITVVLSTEPLISFKYLLAKGWYIMAFVMLPLFLFKNEKIIKNTAVVLASSMLLLVLLTLIRHAQYDYSFTKVNEALTPFYRNHVNYSALLVVMVPLLIGFIRFTRKKVRFFLIVLMVIALGALYFSYARGAWLALVTGFASYWLLKKKWLFASFVIFFILVVSCIFWLKTNNRYLKFAHDYSTTIYHPNFAEHLAATYQMKDVSTAERYYRWIAGVRMIKDSWQNGFGPTTFYHNYKTYTVPAFKTWVSKNEEHSTVHNYFLLLVIEQGIPGLILFLILLGSLFRYAQCIYHRTQNRFWKIGTAGTAAILTMICTVNFLSDLIETDKVGSIFYLCIAYLIIADTKTKNEKSQPSPHVQSIS